MDIYNAIKGKNSEIGVINVMGRTFMGLFESPWALLNDAIEKIKKQLTHFHLTTDDFLMDETFQLESAITEEITYRKINKYFPL